MRYLIATLLEEELRSREPQLIPFRRDMRDHSFLLMRRRGRIYAWLNVCPHWSLPLGQEVGQVFTRQPRGLRCDTHDARFRLEDGQCFWGPCQGETLEPVPHTVALGRVFFFLPHALREGRGPAEGGEIAV